MDEGVTEPAKVARKEGERSEEEFKREVERHLNGEENGSVGDYLF